MTAAKPPVVIALRSAAGDTHAHSAATYATPAAEGFRHVIAVMAGGTSVTFTLPSKIADELAARAASGRHDSVEDLVLDVVGRRRADHRV